MSSQSPIPLGRFELLRILGHGGMAAVWEGRHRRTGREVAVKVVAESRARDPRYRRAFLREVQAVAGLSHPNIVAVYDYGFVPDAAVSPSRGALEPDAPYLVMERADASLAEAPPTDWAGLQRVLLAVLDALAAAHARGTVHRDLKPENVLRVGERWVVADFGLAHVVRGGPLAAAEVTLGASSGTPFYMAPEQFHGEWRKFGPWTDLYALGCVAYQMACGSRPFDAGDVVSLARLHLEAPRPELEPRVPVPPGFQEWVHRLSSIDIAQRPRFAADAARELVRLGPATAREVPGGGGIDVGAPTVLLDETVVLGATMVLVARPEDGDAQPADARAAGRGETRVGDLPESWPEPREPDSVTGLTDVGLSLFGLRDVRTVGRGEELETLWSALRDVIDTRSARIAVVDGGAGTGRTRLARTFTERAHELGAAEAVFVSLERGVPLDTAFGRAVDDHAVLRGLDADEASTRLEQWLFARRDDLPPFVAAAWTELARPTAERRFFFFRSPEEYYNAYSHFFATAAHDLPALVVVLEDVASPEPIAYLRWLVERGLESPILFVVTGKSGRLDEDALPTIDGVRRVDLRPLTVLQQEEFVRRMLPLTPESIRQVAEHTVPNPQFARQLLAEWIAADELGSSARGFVVPDSPEKWPEDVRRLWTRRLDRVVGTETEPLEIASILGARIDLAEWTSALSLAGVAGGDDLVALLAEEGLVRREREDWWFVDPTLREHLQNVAANSGRLERWHLVCVELLSQLEPGEAGSRRRAGHLAKAGELRRAASELMRAAEHMSENGLVSDMVETLKQREQILDRLGVPAQARERVRGEQLLCDKLAKGAADELLERAEDAREKGWLLEASDWLRLAAGRHRDAGKLEEAASLLTEAIELGAAAGDLRSQAYARGHLGWIQMMRGRIAEAEICYRHAIELFDQRGSLAVAAGLRAQLGWIALTRGEFGQARENTAEAARIARSDNVPMILASALNILGEIARFQDDFAEAADQYRQSAEIYEVFQSAHAVSSLLNLGLAQIGMQAWESAESTLLDVRARARAIGLNNRLGIIELGLATIAAGRGDGTRFANLLVRASREIEQSGIVTPDVPWLAERAGTYAEEREHCAGRHAFELAAGQYEQLSKPAEAARIRAMIGDPEG